MCESWESIETLKLDRHYKIIEKCSAEEFEPSLIAFDELVRLVENTVKSSRCWKSVTYLKSSRLRGRALSPESQQLIRVDIDCHGDVFGEWEFFKSFADEAAEAHDGFAADQNVETELAL